MRSVKVTIYHYNTHFSKSSSNPHSDSLWCEITSRMENLTMFQKQLYVLWEVNDLHMSAITSQKMALLGKAIIFLVYHATPLHSRHYTCTCYVTKMNYIGVACVCHTDHEKLLQNLPHIICYGFISSVKWKKHTMCGLKPRPETLTQLYYKYTCRIRCLIGDVWLLK